MPWPTFFPRFLPSRLLGAALAIGLLGTMRAAGPAYELFATGNAADAHPAQTRAGLLLSGGGGDNDDAFRWFVQCAGGGDIVVLRASGADGYNHYLYREIGGVDSVVSIVFHDRKAAFDPQVLDAIARADGIFLAGGDQSLYFRYWQDTPVAAALTAHVRAGKPLGGTSAGLAVLGQHSFAALQPGDLTTAIALANPFDPKVTLESDFLQLDLLREVITDSHFTARARLGRTIAFLARLAERTPHAHGLVGLGIDERTALCLEPDGSGRVFSSDPAGRAWLIVPTKAPEILVAGRPLTFRDLEVTAVGPDSTLQLATRRVIAPASRRHVSVIAGQISVEP